MAIDVSDVAAPNAVDTAGTPDPALSSEPTGDGSPVESLAADPVATDSPPPDTDGSAEDLGELPEGATEEQKQSRADRQFAARLKSLLADPTRAREALAPVLEPLIQADRERQEADRKAAEARAETERTSAAAKQARTEKLASYLGAADTIPTLEREITDLNRQIRAELATPTGADLDDLMAQVAAKESQKDRLVDNNSMVGEVEAAIWSTLEADFVSAAEFPEFGGDPAKQQAYIRAQGGVKGALGVLRETIRSAVNAERDIEIADLKKSHTTSLKAMETDRNIWRQKAGGGDVSPETGGSNGLGTGGSLVQRLIKQAGGEAEFAAKAARGDYRNLDLSG